MSKCIVYLFTMCFNSLNHYMIECQCNRHPLSASQFRLIKKIKQNAFSEKLLICVVSIMKISTIYIQSDKMTYCIKNCKCEIFICTMKVSVVVLSKVACQRLPSPTARYEFNRSTSKCEEVCQFACLKQMAFSVYSGFLHYL